MAHDNFANIRLPNKRRWPSRIKVPERAHPFAKLLYTEMVRQNVSYGELEHKSGILASTFKAYRTNQSSPGLVSMEALLGALGWSLVPVPVSQIADLPEEAAEHLEALGMFFTSDPEAYGAALAATAAWPNYAKALQSIEFKPPRSMRS